MRSFAAILICALALSLTGCRTTPATAPVPIVKKAIIKPVPGAAEVTAKLLSLPVVSGPRFLNLPHCTNCATFGQTTFTAYVTTNNLVRIETGNGQPADWVGPIFFGQHTWTIQYAFNLGDAWQDGPKTDSWLTSFSFNDPSARLPQAFYRIKFQ